MPDDLTLTQGFPDALRPQAARLYDAAFGAKLSVAISDGPARLALLAAAFDPSHALVARVGGELVGIAGFQSATGSLTSGITFAQLRHHLGLFRALWAALILALYERPSTPGQLLMDGISVSPNARGRGVGTALLNHLIDFATHQGYQTIRLDVIDTNPGARRLYERLGFVAIRTERFDALRGLLGFGAATTLAFQLPATS